MQVETEPCGGPRGGGSGAENSRVAELPANTHRPYKHEQANGAGPASSVISESAGGSGTHAHARNVVRTVVKSHRSKGADTFDQLHQRTAKGVGGPVTAATCSHPHQMSLGFCRNTEKMNSDYVLVLALIGFFFF